MITTTREVTLLDGSKYVLGTPGIPQIWQIDLTIRYMDERTGFVGDKRGEPISFHCSREPLERAGLIPRVVLPAEDHGSTSVEDLVLRLLHRLGVRFED